MNREISTRTLGGEDDEMIVLTQSDSSEACGHDAMNPGRMLLWYTESLYGLQRFTVGLLNVYGNILHRTSSPLRVKGRSDEKKF